MGRYEKLKRTSQSGTTLGQQLQLPAMGGIYAPNAGMYMQPNKMIILATYTTLVSAFILQDMVHPKATSTVAGRPLKRQSTAIHKSYYTNHTPTISKMASTHRTGLVTYVKDPAPGTTITAMTTHACAAKT